MSEEKNSYNKNLTELRSSRYEIAEGEPDIRGWLVRTLQNQEIGKVKELLFDTSSLRVRYVVVQLDGKPLNLVSRDLLIPIGLAELHEKEKVVLFPEISVGHFASLPEYKRGKVTMQFERDIRAVFAPSSGIVFKEVDYNDPEEFYNNEYFDEKRMDRQRERPADDKIVRERIIPRDRMNNDRTKTEGINGPIQEGGFAPFQEGAIEIKEHSEVPVVSKEARVVEEVSINKQVTERNEKVKDSVRKTEIDIEKLSKEDISKK
ncbi:MAG: DUF2382 domain-containing protein [Chitinophagaceae bacterium]